MILKNLLDLVCDLVFPKTCLACGRAEGYLCFVCEREIGFLQEQVCPNCRRKSEFGKVCGEKCARVFASDQLVVCCNYEKSGLLKRLLVLLKYKFAEEVAGILGKMMKQQLAYFSHNFGDFENVVFVPVPAHQKRLKYRGFNQALLLADYLSKSFCGIKLVDCMERKVFRKTQVHANREERIENLAGSFEVKTEFAGKNGFSDFLTGKTVILVDDIATTCSTLNECSKVLKSAGVGYVCGLVLARGKF